MTFFTALHFSWLLLAAFLVWLKEVPARVGKKRAVRGLYAATCQFILSLEAWETDNPAFWFVLMHTLLAVIFVGWSTSRSGFWTVVLFCVLVVVDMLALMGVVTRELYPHLLGAGWAAFLILIYKACSDGPDYRPYLGRKSFDVFGFRRGDGGWWRSPLPSPKEAAAEQQRRDA